MNFLSVFLYENREKGNSPTCRMAGPAGALTWRAGPPRGCDAALRPRGRAAGAQSRCRRRIGRRHTAQGHACPRGSTGMPVRGATWQVRLAYGGPTG